MRPKLSFFDYLCNVFIKRQKLLKMKLSVLKTNNWPHKFFFLNLA